MASIDDLPVELLSRVFRFLYIENRTDAFQLSYYDEPEESGDEDDIGQTRWAALFPHCAVARTCRLWRRILAVTPNYWDRVIFDLCDDPTPWLDSFGWSKELPLQVAVFNSSPDARCPNINPELQKEFAELELSRMHTLMVSLTPHIERCTLIYFFRPLSLLQLSFSNTARLIFTNSSVMGPAIQLATPSTTVRGKCVNFISAALLHDSDRLLCRFAPDAMIFKSCDIPPFDDAFFSSKVILENIPASTDLRGILHTWFGTDLIVRSSPCFNDALLVWLSEDRSRARFLTILDIENCDSITIKALQKLIRRKRKSVNSYSSDNSEEEDVAVYPHGIYMLSVCGDDFSLTEKELRWFESHVEDVMFAKSDGTPFEPSCSFFQLTVNQDR
ncbi:unnamed protein product [Cyclocybe aegerita]|uniref:F-box domain-containing protein n=1 Tax=Cyclocybe aegerita TaxID=1973307 RepID=A0A8S0Y0C7_CYCAE|nr:unnamed protein product [Cyclocybe aegerita]